MMISLCPAQAAAAGAMRAMDRKRLLGMLVHPRMAFRLRAHTISIGRTSAHGMVDIDLSLLGGAHVRRASRLQVAATKKLQHPTYLPGASALAVKQGPGAVRCQLCAACVAGAVTLGCACVAAILWCPMQPVWLEMFRRRVQG